MDNPHVLLDTTIGDILLELYADKAPETVANFLQYVEDGHYNGTLFHRVVRGFVTQGGGYDRDLMKKETRAPIKNEADNGLSNEKDTVAMARGPEKDSATDEFFFNAVDNPSLDHEDETDEGFGYCVFGRIVEGMDVAKKINWKVVKVRGDFEALPVDSIWIVSASVF